MVTPSTAIRPGLCLRPAPRARDWSSNSRFVNAPFGDWPEMICTENPHCDFAGKKAAILTADKPDF
jgi:hypothetical protein